MFICAELVLVFILVQIAIMVLSSRPNLFSIHITRRLWIFHPGAIKLVRYRLVIDGFSDGIQDDVCR